MWPVCSGFSIWRSSLLCAAGGLRFWFPGRVSYREIGGIRSLRATRLVGCALGVLLGACPMLCGILIPSWLGYPEPHSLSEIRFRNCRRPLIYLNCLAKLVAKFLLSLGLLCLLFLLRVLLRNEKAAIVCVGALCALLAASEQSLDHSQYALVMYALMLFCADALRTCGICVLAFCRTSAHYISDHLRCIRLVFRLRLCCSRNICGHCSLCLPLFARRPPAHQRNAPG